MKHLDELKGPYKMEVQNLCYRYFAESARHFKKIQHSIRSGEAELQVSSDGEVPRPQDLQEAFADFQQAVCGFEKWQIAEQEKMKQKLMDMVQELEDQHFREKVGNAGLLGLTTAAGAWGFCAVAGAAGYAYVAAGVLGGAAGAAGSVTPNCLDGRKNKDELVGFMKKWAQSALDEKSIFEWMSSLTSVLQQNQSFTAALQSTQEIRNQLDEFLQRLQSKGLIFDPTCWK